MDEDKYKVERLLPRLMARAVTAQKGANISVDCRLYFRLDPNDGQLKGEVAFADPQPAVGDSDEPPRGLCAA